MSDIKLIEMVLEGVIGAIIGLFLGEFINDRTVKRRNIQSSGRIIWYIVGFVVGTAAGIYLLPSLFTFLLRH